MKVCFEGTGNYHYLTYFFLKQIQQDFCLVLFDHHTDMQPSAFGEILSCGSWLYYALKRVPFLQQVFVIGASQEMIGRTALHYPKVICVSEEQLRNKDHWIAFLKNHIYYPVYFSVDKDVFCQEDVQTNWDQGSLKLNDFMRIKTELFPFITLLGVDICGDNQNAYRGNDQVNRQLIRCFEAADKKKSPY